MALHLKMIIFIIVTAVIVWVSWPSLRDIRSHGFYRFFAFETILLLALLNINYWFHEPFSYHQVISWILLIACTYFGIHGVLLLHKIGKPDRTRNDPSLMGIEKTTELVTVGLYAYVRHPLYSSLLFLTWGAFFKHPSGVGVCLALIATFFLTMTAKMEETENIRFFGSSYRDYMKRSKMFVPFLF
jgi:protein-S-isoprenylcysteine O-methyltransferase Ste14